MTRLDRTLAGGYGARLLSARVGLARLGVLVAWLATAGGAAGATNYVVLGWGEMGMHFMDGDYSVFSIHPPGSTIHGQVVQNAGGVLARLVTNAAAAGISVTFEAVADPDGSISRTSADKVNFWDFALPLLGTNLPPDTGLSGVAMPGSTNAPRPMAFSADRSWFTAAGVPVVPYDDSGRFNPFPLMRLVARQNGTVLGSLDVVSPVTDEMDCRVCHASGASGAAEPDAGWVYDPLPDRDYRLNILRLHDERQAGKPAYASALAVTGYGVGGLYARAAGGSPILCVNCHASNLLPGRGIAAIKPLTQAMHRRHASVLDPRTGQTLDSETNRNSCYTCHGGQSTHFLRGAMGTADSSTGALAIQCQSCHGTMTMVGATNRVGWMSEPNCQACHVGDAINNVGGQIRYSLALTTSGVLRTTTNLRFATNPDTPTNGVSLFRFSKGHSNLMCSACHGPAHAEFPSSARNDNIQSLQHQGHYGVQSECDTCHGTQDLSANFNGGPHGMHPHDLNWVNNEHMTVQSTANCGPCHGNASGRSKQGTILSQARADRSYATTIFGQKDFWRGQIIGCTYCHDSSAAPTANNTAAATTAGAPVTFTLSASTNNARIVTQPPHGMVGLSGLQATYTPEEGFVGTDTFTFASSTGKKESNLAVGTVVVTPGVSTVGDGLPDWWRAARFGGDGKGTNAVSASGADPDADGMDNRQEYLAGTDPLDPRSVVRLVAIRAASGDVQLGFQTTVAKRYTVERRSDPSPGGWAPVVSNIWGRNATVYASDTNAPGAWPGVYRIRVQP